MQDDTFVSAVQFVHRRYLTGQSVLATTVREQAWIGREMPHEQTAEDLTVSVLRVLRGSPGPVITEQSICELDLNLKRALSSTNAVRAEAAKQRLGHIWELLDDVGAGRLFTDNDGRTFLKKSCRSALTKKTLEWMQQNRVPGYLFGITDVALGEEPEPGTDLKGTNPSVSVQARKARGVTRGAEGTEKDEAGELAPNHGGRVRKKREGDEGEAGGSCPRRLRRLTTGGEAQTLVSEVVTGVLLGQGDVRGRLRERLRSLDQRAILSDVKPIRHDFFYKAKGVCRGSSEKPCPVSRVATYYRQEYGVPARTFIVLQYGQHEHVGDGTDSGRIFSPLQEAAAKRFLSLAGPHTGAALTTYLVSQGFAESALPSSARRSRWLLNQKAGARKAATTMEAQVPRQEIIERSLSAWLKRKAETQADLCVLDHPAHALSSQRVCIVFACQGMLKALGRVNTSALAVAVDVKRQCMQHGWGVATLSVLAKDELRNTTLGRNAGGRRVQGQAWTAHAAPVLQAIVNAETADNFEHIFRATCDGET